MKNKHSKAGRKQNSAGIQMDSKNALNRNLGFALFGKAALKEEKLKIIGLFEKVGKTPESKRKFPMCHAHQSFDEIARPELLDALLKQDPQPFLEYAAAIEAAKRIKNEGQPIQPFHAKILRFAGEINWEFTPGQTIPFTAKQLKSRLKLPQSVEYIRRECKRIGVRLLAGKAGRPRKPPTIPRPSKS